jgi:alpha-L-arabinofuranosidase
VGRKEPINISIDEWNIRHSYDGKHNRKSERTMQDAVFTAGFLNAMIRKAPRVEMANYVFLVNGNATLLVKDDLIVCRMDERHSPDDFCKLTNDHSPAAGHEHTRT